MPLYWQKTAADGFEPVARQQFREKKCGNHTTSGTAGADARGHFSLFYFWRRRGWRGNPSRAASFRRSLPIRNSPGFDLRDSLKGCGLTYRVRLALADAPPWFRVQLPVSSQR